MRQLLVQRLSLEQKLLGDIHRAHPAAAAHRDMGKLIPTLKSACASLAQYRTVVGGYLQSGSPSRLTMISLATRLLLQTSLISGRLPRCCSSSEEGSNNEALGSHTFLGWALCSLTLSGPDGENCISLFWPLNQTFFSTPSLLQIDDF